MRTLVLVLAGLLAGAGAARAGQRPVPLPDPARDMRPAEVQRLFDAYVVMRAEEALGLSEEQYTQFVPRLRALHEARRSGQQARVRIINELRRLTSPRNSESTDEAQLTERLDALQEAESRSAAEVRKAYHALDEILDPRQQARFRVFEEQMERRKLDLLLRARQNSRPPKER